MITKKKMNIVKGIQVPFLLLLLLMIPFYGEAMRIGVVRGIRLCVSTIIPSVFPFMILSSVMIGYSVFDHMDFLSLPFEKLFHVGKSGLPAFLCGSLCGFPLGAKCAAEAYMQGYLSKDESERLIGFSSNASPAFVICGIGAMRKSIAEGVLLYVVMLLSAIIVGIIFGIKKEAHPRRVMYKTQNFSFTDTVERAGINTLYVCSYLLLFSALIGVLQAFFLKNSVISAIFLPFFEIGSATAFLAKVDLPSGFSMALTAFAVSFGGLSVHLQSAGLLRGTKISMKHYYIAKLLQGLLSFFIVLFIGLFCPFR
jgi:sporulation integral membrane protein YlbJ